MRIYPAIDIRNGQCVRLQQGDFGRETVYNPDPSAQAGIWAEAGCSYIHTVDLDGARSGIGRNDTALQKILADVSVPVQIGGGIRTMEDVDRKIRMGFSRVILGTAAAQNPEFIRQAVEKYGSDHVAAGVDAKDGYVAVSGWEETAALEALSFCLRLKTLGVRTVIYTDIARDGMLTGPNIEATARLMERTGLDIIASGGVSCMEDLERLAGVGVSGVIVGRALYTGTVNLSEAIRRFEKPIIPA